MAELLDTVELTAAAGGAGPGAIGTVVDVVADGYLLVELDGDELDVVTVPPGSARVIEPWPKPTGSR